MSRVPLTHPNRSPVVEADLSELPRNGYTPIIAARSLALFQILVTGPVPTGRSKHWIDRQVVP